MKTFDFNEKEIEMLQLALKVLIDNLDKNNDASITIANALSRRFREYSEELFASVHSQGG